MMDIRCLFLILFAWGTVKAGGDMQYTTATGKFVMAKGDEEKWCSTATWYEDVDVKRTKIQKKGFQSLISEEGTRIAKDNEETNNVECKMDSNYTFDEFRENGKSEKYKIGGLNFSKPMTGFHEIKVTNVKVASFLEKSVSLIWIKGEAPDLSWAGIDWITDDPGFARIWWDQVDMTKPNPPSLLDITGCDDALGSDPMTDVDCANYFEDSEASYKMDMPLEGSGVLQQSPTSEAKDWFSMPSKFYNDPAKKLFGVVNGDPAKKTDTKAFNLGYWSNATGTYLMFPGEGGCTWMGDWKYQDAVDGYSTPQMSWIGTAIVKQWWSHALEGTEVNLYLGNYPMGPGFPIMVMVDTDGLYRGKIMFDYELTHPPKRVVMEKIERKTPDFTNLLPAKDCVGYEFFTGEVLDFDTDGGQKATMINSGCFILLISIGLFMQSF